MGKEFMIVDGLRLEYARYSSDVLGVENGQLDGVTLCLPPTLSRTGKWKIHSFINCLKLVNLCIQKPTLSAAKTSKLSLLVKHHILAIDEAS